MILALAVAFVAFLIAQLIKSSRDTNTLIPPKGNLLIFDIETNGAPKNWKASIDDIDNWPNMVSISWFKIDPSGKIISNKYFTIIPEGFSISEEATLIHQITNEIAEKTGLHLNKVVEYFESDLGDCKYLVAHNIEFDFAVIYSEYIRLQKNTSQLLALNQICTMKSSVDYCKISSQKGYKYPKLSELYYKIFSTSFNGVHNAQADAEACMKCFKELYNLNIIKF